MAGVWAYARIARRAARDRRGGRGFVDAEPAIGDSASGDTEPSLASMPGVEGDAGTNTLMAIDDLAGIFAPRREMSDVELSTDVGILAGLRSSYESTMDGTVAPTPGVAPEIDPIPVDAVEASPSEGASSTVAEAPAAAVSGPGTDESLAIDMSLPLVYLTLLSKDKRLPGRTVIEALEDDGFRPGLMQLYYRRSDFDPAVVVGVANMVESGALDPESLPEIETPGLVSFIGVPDDPAQALKRFNTMVAASRRLAMQLRVKLCDETRSELTPEAESRMRERVGSIARRSRGED